MKSFKLLLFTCILFFISCSREHESLPQPANPGSIAYTVNNPNALNWIGILHNDLVISMLDTHLLDSVHHDSTLLYPNVLDYMLANNSIPVDTPVFPAGSFSIALTTMISDLTDDVKGFEVTGGTITNLTLNDFDDLMTYYDNMAATTLSSPSERNVIYAMTSIGRHSARLWAPESAGGLGAGDIFPTALPVGFWGDVISDDMDGMAKGMLTAPNNQSRVRHGIKEAVIDSVFTAMRYMWEDLFQ